MTKKKERSFSRRSEQVYGLSEKKNEKLGKNVGQEGNLVLKSVRKANGPSDSGGGG